MIMVLDSKPYRGLEFNTNMGHGALLDLGQICLDLLCCELVPTREGATDVSVSSGRVSTIQMHSKLVAVN